MVDQMSRRYSLRPGFIGPLTRRQALRRIRNQQSAAARTASRKALRAITRMNHVPVDDYDGGTYYDNFVDGWGF